VGGASGSGGSALAGAGGSAGSDGIADAGGGDRGRGGMQGAGVGGSRDGGAADLATDAPSVGAMAQSGCACSVGLAPRDLTSDGLASGLMVVLGLALRRRRRGR
jgi:MYXO-CTERM domain-containing protein